MIFTVFRGESHITYEVVECNFGTELLINRRPQRDPLCPTKCYRPLSSKASFVPVSSHVRARLFPCACVFCSPTHIHSLFAHMHIYIHSLFSATRHALVQRIGNCAPTPLSVGPVSVSKGIMYRKIIVI